MISGFFVDFRLLFEWSENRYISMPRNFGRESGIRPEWLWKDAKRTVRLPPERPPLTTFRAHVKQLVLGGMQPALLGLLFAAFPGFLATMTDPPLESLAWESLEKFDLNRCDYVRRRRRFAGLMGLPGGRYYTLSHDALGDDGGTLLRELSAYADPVKGGVVFDAVDGIGGIGFRGQKIEPERAITLRMSVPREPCRRSNPQILKAWLEFFKQSAIPLVDLGFVVTLPYSVEHKEVTRVLDLREIEAQEWLLSAFAIADHDLLVKADRKKISSFVELLPALLAPALGGNIITDAIGAYLRWVGAGGLVFPSARSDCFVSYTELKLVDFIGAAVHSFCHKQMPASPGMEPGLWPPELEFSSEPREFDLGPALIVEWDPSGFASA